MHLTQIVILSPRRPHAQEARASSMARLQRAAAVRSPGGQDLQTGPLAGSIDGVELVERAPNAGLDRAVGAPVSRRRPAGRSEPETAGRRSPEAGANSGRSRHISVEETTLSLRHIRRSSRSLHADVVWEEATEGETRSGGRRRRFWNKRSRCS
jgi:hypothetical protein